MLGGWDNYVQHHQLGHMLHVLMLWGLYCLVLYVFLYPQCPQALQQGSRGSIQPAGHR